MPEGQNHNKNIWDIFDLRKEADILKFKGYEDRKERINSENKRSIGQILALYGVVVIVNLIAQKLRFKSILQDMGLMSDIFYMLFANLFFFFYLRKKDINFTRAIYLFDLPIFIISILQGTIWDPFNLTYTFFFLSVDSPASDSGQAMENLYDGEQPDGLLCDFGSELQGTGFAGRRYASSGQCLPDFNGSDAVYPDGAYPESGVCRIL